MTHSEVTLSPPALALQRARDQFFNEHRDPEDGVAPVIGRSWRRSLPLDVQAIDTAPMPRSMLVERREQAMRLLECAQPELDGLAEHAVGNGCVVILSDASGLILDEIGSPDFLPKAERIALTPGIEWSEGRRGTNAIGTALAERDALMVLGGEHFLAQNGSLGCAAAPIFTGRGAIAGVLDISGEAVRVNPHALGLVRMAAQQVEHRMMLAERGGHLLRFHRRPGLLGTAREGLVVIEHGRVAGANRAALAMLQATWDSLLGLEIEPLLGIGWSRLERQRGLITLPDGRQIAAIAERRAPAVSVSRSRAGGAAASPRWPAVGSTELPSPNRSQADASDALLPSLHRAIRVLDAGVPVLISGETGSGKEVFARRLHAACRRRAGPFVAVNCAALPESLIEAELFGYEEGAFTGARRRGMPGRIREADGGVLFLDEIADMPLALQPRLLRVLEEREVTPLGGGTAVKVDFDLVCATHGDLPALAADGRFRSDLLYRVAGYAVALPALRDRADRRSLITRLFAECGGDMHHLQLADDALEHLCAWCWPGNVRELRSTLLAMAALAEPGDTVSLEHLPLSLLGHPPAHAGGDAGFARQAGCSSGLGDGASQDKDGCGNAVVGVGDKALLSSASGHRGGAATATEVNSDIEWASMSPPLAAITRQAIVQALADAGQNVAEAARRLGIHRSTVYRHRDEIRRQTAS